MEKAAATTAIVEGEPQLPGKKQKRGEPQQQHHGEVITVDVDPEALSCRKCLHLLLPPVFQCAAGHLICSSCHDNLLDKNKCGSCFITSFIATSYSRCHGVEGILRSVRVTCPNALTGCTVGKMLYHEMAEHQKTCPSIAASGGLPRGVVKMGPCGSDDGGDAMDMDVGCVDRIIKVVVWHNEAVDAISVLYEQDGREKETSPVWGQACGDSSEFYLGSDEYLTGLKGHVGHYNGGFGENLFIVRSLTFVSNRNTFGPYGEEEGLPFELPAAGGRIVGFHGRADGNWLHALGTYVKMVI